MDKNHCLALLSLIEDLETWAEHALDPADLELAKPNIGKLMELARKHPSGRPKEDTEEFDNYWEQFNWCVDLPFMTFRETCDALSCCIRKRLESAGK